MKGISQKRDPSGSIEQRKWEAAVDHLLPGCSVGPYGTGDDRLKIDPSFLLTQRGFPRVLVNDVQVLALGQLGRHSSLVASGSEIYL